MDNSGGNQADTQAANGPASDNRAKVQTGLGGRYATALFELAHERGRIAAVESSLAHLAEAMQQSEDLAHLAANPMLSRNQTSRAMTAVAKALKLDDLTCDFLGVLAANRRLAALPAIARAFDALASQARGEIAAEVTSARPLAPAQVKALAAKLKARVGRDVTLTRKTDPEILGGLVVKIGSQMIDSSIRTRLNTLALAMKG